MTDQIREADASMKSELVAALYATPGTILIGAITVAAVMAAAALLTNHDPVFHALAAGMLGVGLFRIAAHRRYEATALAGASEATITKLERRAMIGAWSTAALIAAFGSYAVVRYTYEPVAVLAIAQTIGYLAGISGRNTSRPLITRGQVLIAAAPFVLALGWTGDAAYLVIGLSVALTTVLTFSSARVIHEVFVARLSTMQELEHLAVNDAITNLFNRRGFMREIRAADAAGQKLTLISIDIDRFKAINDTFGHDVGDALLKSISETLHHCLDSGDIAARTGGDEFMIATSRNEEEASLLAGRLIMMLGRRRILNGRHITASASMGIAPAGCAKTIDDALKCVDIALYRAKLDGRNRFVLYTPSISYEHEDNLALEADMRDAIRDGQFQLHFQPIYNPRSGTATMVEALLRWEHPRRGQVAPSVFIPLAERIGLIRILGAWALEEAARSALALPRSVSVSVNVSARQFEHDHDFVAIVEAVLRMTGLDPHRLTLEITETALIDDSPHVVECLVALRALGVRIALDDFGTGYSSLSYLAHLPIDTIKIDQAFSQEIGSSRKAEYLMNAITQLAHDLKLRIIVEGIETEEQLAVIGKYAIHGIQGYVFSRPLPFDALQGMISNRVTTGRSKTARGAAGSKKPSDRYSKVA